MGWRWMIKNLILWGLTENSSIFWRVFGVVCGFHKKKKKGVTMEGRLLKKEVLNSLQIWKGACRNWGDGFFEFLNCEGGGG